MAAEKADNRVEIYIERGNANDEPNLLVSVNGKNYNLPRGKASLVPPEVAEEVYRARRAQEALDAKIDKLQAEMAENATRIK